MQLTQITADSIADAAITQQKIDPNVQLGGGPKITAVQVCDSTYTPLDDTAVSLDGGFLRITGTGFATGVQVLINNTPATSVQFVSSTRVHVQVPARAAGSYVVYLVNTDGGVAISVTGVTYSQVPIWTTSSPLPETFNNTAFSIQLQASPASVYSLASGSTLPTGVTLSSTGLLSGTITGLSSNTTYNFIIAAIDSENQDSPRTFALPVSVVVPTGQTQYISPGTYSWTVPTGVTTVSAVLIGGGGNNSNSSRFGGGGGGLRFINSLPVTPGETLSVVVGSSQQNSSISRASNVLVFAGGGTNGVGGTGSTTGSGPFGGTIGGGNGGSGGGSNGSVAGGGGGGAGGYSGNGGLGGNGASSGTTGNTAGNSGSGGSGGGGGGAASFSGGNSIGGGGGGTGILGQGTSGSGGAQAPGGGGSGNWGRGGSGGSSGDAGADAGQGGNYGGGSGGADGNAYGFSNGGTGAVRIIWGPNRAFPSTNTGNL